MKHLLSVVVVILICKSLLYGRQEQTVSLTSGGFTTVSGQKMGTPVSSSTTAGTPLIAAINFGDVTPSIARRIKITIPIRISATTSYKVELRRVSVSQRAGIKPSDIGFHIQDIRPQSSNTAGLTPTAIAGVIVSERFAADVSEIRITNGRPLFKGTLAEIGESPTVILRGVPTVANGTLNADENSITANLVFTIVPQLFLYTQSFELPLTLTISQE